MSSPEATPDAEQPPSSIAMPISSQPQSFSGRTESTGLYVEGQQSYGLGSR